MSVPVLVLLFLQITFNFINLSETRPAATCDNNVDSDVEGYYWRDYKDVIPKDALPGGKNEHGKDTYIGQVLHQGLLIPAKIDSEDGKVTYEWGYTEHVASINIKILCTKSPEDFEWVDTGNQHINNIKDKHFVVGGYEPEITTLIGRKQIDGEVSVGKVVFGPKQSTLNISKNGKVSQHGSFQVLAYNPTTPQNKPPSNKCKQSRPVIIYFYN